MPVDKFGRMIDAKTRDTGVSLTYINNNYVRSDGGTPITGSTNMNGNTLYNVSDPVNPQDVATKEYTDKVREVIPFFKKNDNYQATHMIDMAYKKLVNLQKPTDPYDDTTKDYVDYVKSILNKSLIILTQLYFTLSRTQEENKEKINKTLEEINKTQEEINKTQEEINERIDNI